MGKRFVTIWFCHLKTDWFSRRKPALSGVPFVLTINDHGRKRITEANPVAQRQNIYPGMVLADARAFVPALQAFEDHPFAPNKLLTALASYCIRYTDIVAIEPPEGLKLDVTGCAHLWGGEENYIRDIRTRLKNFGYEVRVSMADTPGAAWAIAHYSGEPWILEPDGQETSLLPLPVASLQLESSQVELLTKLGLRQVRHLTNMPRAALRRRFGDDLILKLDQAMGKAEEILLPVQPVELCNERLPCLEPIVTLKGIEIALERLLETICGRLQNKHQGMRQCRMNCFRLDGRVEKIEIGTHRGIHNKKHLFKLFELKISTIEPGPGIDLFMIEVLQMEKLSPHQESLWKSDTGMNEKGISELMDRLSNRFGEQSVHRYLPQEQHWPERSFKSVHSLGKKSSAPWFIERRRPLQLLSRPERVEVTAPIPDYPPMFFTYKSKRHKIKKSDGPERIEREWWMDAGNYRDYYAVEDEEGNRYWIFRSGAYEESKSPHWYIHGFFA